MCEGIPLAKTLTKKQIEAGLQFWHEGNWDSATIARLQRDHPDPTDAVEDKIEIINKEYGTYVKKVPVAECIRRWVRRRSSATGPDAIEELVQEIFVATDRKEHVFVSKYCHFFY